MGNLDGYSLYRMLFDDDRFDMKKDDVFIGTEYDGDDEKVSVGFRISDGFDPRCNQYKDSVHELTEKEVEDYIWNHK